MTKAHQPKLFYVRTSLDSQMTTTPSSVEAAELVNLTPGSLTCQLSRGLGFWARLGAQPAAVTSNPELLGDFELLMQAKWISKLETPVYYYCRSPGNLEIWQSTINGLGTLLPFRPWNCFRKGFGLYRDHWTAQFNGAALSLPRLMAFINHYVKARIIKIDLSQLRVVGYSHSKHFHHVVRFYPLRAYL